MADKITPVIKALDNLGAVIAKSHPGTNTLKEQFGWNFPPLTKFDIAQLAQALARKLELVDKASISDKFNPATMVARIDQAAAELPPYLWNGSGTEAFRSYTSLLDWIEAAFSGLFIQKVDWEKLEGSSSIPNALARKIRGLDARVKTITSGVGNLDTQVASITAAHDAALALPTDLETLDEARSKIIDLSKGAEKDAISASSNAELVATLLNDVKTSRDEAVQLVKNTEDAYSAATTVGLGGAFQQRAQNLSRSMWVWVGGLLLALASGAAFGLYRIALIERLIDRNASMSVIWLNMVLAVLSIAAPVWFAWIATKQIGHRFRLSEDYAFKSSVARAYEGYRREAARLDPAFERRLFESALNRLDEPPLRFVEHETPGSPWHDGLGARLSQFARKRSASRDQAADAPNSRGQESQHEE